MEKFGLIGYPLTHSFSKQLFDSRFSHALEKHVAPYTLFPLPDLRDLPELLIREPQLRGFNVTIPHKIGLLSYVDELTPEAASVQAINTVRVERTEKIKLIGHNTDLEGFRVALLDFIGASRPKALVLGNGGAARSVCQVLKELAISYQVISRTAPASGHTFESVTPDIIREHPLIINATPVGMSPNVHEAPPIPYQAITSSHFLFDLVYNPEVTLFLERGRKAGAHTLNGMEMLRLQAMGAWKFWGLI